MKLLGTIFILLFGALANAQSRIEIEEALASFLPQSKNPYMGIDQKGHPCRVERSYLSTITIVSKKKGCLDEATNSLMPECISEFAAYHSRLKVKKFELDAGSLEIEVGVKADDQYSGTRYARVIMERDGQSLQVKVADKKGWFGYSKKNQLVCYLKIQPTKE